MDFNLFYKFKDNKSEWVTVVFYLAIALLLATVFCYGLFTVKIYLQNQKLNQLNEKIAVYGSSQEKAAEAQVFEYKKNIDNFSMLVSSHKFSLNIFTFIEANTLPNVWFSSFDDSESQYQINLSGEADNLETLSNQIQIFEDDTKYVKNISVLNSQLDNAGRVQFVLNMTLDPTIFSYNATSLVSATPNATASANVSASTNPSATPSLK